MNPLSDRVNHETIAKAYATGEPIELTQAEIDALPRPVPSPFALDGHRHLGELAGVPFKLVVRKPLTDEELDDIRRHWIENYSQGAPTWEPAVEPPRPGWLARAIARIFGGGAS